MARSTRCVLSLTAVSARSDQRVFGTDAEGNVDFNFHRRGVDTDQCVRRELREHTLSVIHAEAQIDQGGQRTITPP